MKYTQTHSWISFKLKSFDDHDLWFKLGEASSKCAHLSSTPLEPAFAKRLNEIYLAKGVMATTAIEGNTLTEEQVLQQVDGELDLPPSQDYLKQEIDNIIKVCNEEIQAQMKNDETKMPLCPDLIKHYNKMILHDLELEEGVAPGEFRLHSVLVGNVYRGAPAEDCEYLVDRLCDWLKSDGLAAPSKDLAIPFAIIRAVIAHLYLAWIHPFGDGNGRTARLVEFHILFSNGVPLPASHLLSDHYNRTRSKYYRELDKASKSGGDIMPFIKYAMQGFLDGLRHQIDGVNKHQMKIAWNNYVHEKFREQKPSKTQKRRRDVVLELSKYDEKKVSEIEEMSGKIAKLYAKGQRMVQRDLNELEKMNLIVRSYGKVRANKRLVQAYMPVTIPPDEQNEENGGKN